MVAKYLNMNWAVHSLMLLYNKVNLKVYPALPQKEKDISSFRIMLRKHGSGI
jgi:hypothetical protein